MLEEELTEYSRSCPAWLAYGSGQEHGKAEKRKTNNKGQITGVIFDNIGCR